MKPCNCRVCREGRVFARHLKRLPARERAYFVDLYEKLAASNRPLDRSGPFTGKVFCCKHLFVIHAICPCAEFTVVDSTRGASHYFQYDLPPLFGVPIPIPSRLCRQSADYKALYIAALKAQRDKLNEAIALAEGLPELNGGSGGPVTFTAVGASTTIRPGSFYGMTILDATKKFLAMSPNEPRGAPQIVEALQQGGYTFNTASPLNTVGSVLSREETRGGDVVRVGRGLFGLAEWYPGRPRKKRGAEREGVNELPENDDLPANPDAKPIDPFSSTT